ncbi:MAG: hypothetical protein D3924_04210 [Candidatus Electrothrix sp. AR4]|nr:hypothetical protein [Candidatus Electrothrix sp. AR4]
MVDIEDFSKDDKYFEEAFAVGREQLGQDWLFRIVPVVNGQVIPELALRDSSQMPLPDQKFAQQWNSVIDRPFLSAKITTFFEEAVSVCSQISAILNCRDIENMHPEEDEVLSEIIDSFKRNQELLSDAAEETESEEVQLALGYLDEIWSQVVNEFEVIKNGQEVKTPFCWSGSYSLTGDLSDKTTEFGAVRLLLLQAECRMVTRK